MTNKRSTSKHGGILIMTLVLVTMFLVIFIGLSGMVSRTFHEGVLQAQDEIAFQIAESGLNFGRWRLAHEANNFSTDTRVIADQYAGNIGQFQITFTPPVAGSTIVEIVATGQTTNHPARQVVLRARYGQPSLARYASITNSDVWYGGNIQGAVHSNGGIRMDGSSDSLMTSEQATYPCQPYHGCASPFQTKPGIWGSGTTQELWEYPAPRVDYSTLTQDLLAMKTAAQGLNTYYGSSSGHGYHIVFNDNNTYSISRVTALGSNLWSWWRTDGWLYTSHDVGATQFIETKAVPANGVIYVEGRTWIQGDIRGRVTVAAGVFPDNPSTNADIIINGNISYGGVKDGSRSFAAIAQRHIQIPYSGAPNNLTLDGAYIAQKGSFHRRYYNSGAHRLKTKLTRFGMIASNGVPATAWVSGGSVVSGYQQGQTSYDPNLLYAPPPYFPTDGQYQFISWEEDQ